MAAVEDRHFWFVGTRIVIMDVLRRALGDRLNGARVLDVGCGTGFTLTKLPDGVNAVGLDASEHALAHTRRRSSATLVRGSATSLPFAAETFDAVLCLDVLEHLDDDRAAAAEIQRILRPGGVALVTVPAFQMLWSDHDEALAHRRRYRLREIEKVLESTGLTLEIATYYNALLFPAIAAVRTLSKLRRARPTGAETHVSVPPSPVNAVLTRVLASERHVIGHARFPAGVSCLLVARKGVPTSRRADR